MAFKAFTDYLSLEKKYSSHTVTAYTKDLESFSEFAKSEFDYKHIDSVNYSVIRSWIIHLVNNGVSNRSVNRKISSLKTYYKFLLKTNQIEINPLAKHRALKTSKKIQVPTNLQSICNEFAKVQLQICCNLQHIYNEYVADILHFAVAFLLHMLKSSARTHIQSSARICTVGAEHVLSQLARRIEPGISSLDRKQWSKPLKAS